MNPRHLLRERSLRAGLTAVVFLAAVGFARHADQHGLAPKSFWAIKCAARDRADLVLMGDSQTLIGLSPEAMAAELPNSRIFNFGFEALNFSAPYLAHARKVIARDAPAPAVLLGVTALTLTENPAQDGYTSYMSKHRVWLDPYFGSLRNFFAPITTREIVNTISPAARVIRYAHFHADGWLETANDPPSNDGAQVYSGIFKPSFRGPVSPAKEDVLLEAVRGWRAEGIEVYAFTPPLDPKVQAIINTDAGWDPKDLVRRMKSAGAHWIDLDSYSYRTYDGVHLEPDSARHLSTHLARAIAQDRASRKP